MLVVTSVLTVLFFVGSHFNLVQSTIVADLPEEYSTQAFQTKAGILETTFLGPYNSRMYFLGNGKESQYSAYANCRNAGMELVTFAGKEDLSWLQSKLNITALLNNKWIWMDANNLAINSCYSSQSGGKTLSNVFNVVDHKLTGLLFDRYPGNTYLIQSERYMEYPYVCVS